MSSRLNKFSENSFLIRQTFYYYIVMNLRFLKNMYAKTEAHPRINRGIFN